MSAPFCTACGAAVAEGTRFCTKCGQPVGQAAPPPASPAPPTDDPTLHLESWSPSPASVPEEPLPPPPAPVMMDEPVKQGSGAGIWIAIFGLVLLIGGAGLWFYTVKMRAANATGVQVAATPVAAPDVQTPAPASPEPAAPTPVPTPEVVPPNPDFKGKDSTPPPAPKTAPPTPEPKSDSEGNPPIAPPVPVADPGPAPAPAPVAPTPALRKPQGPTSGVLHAAVEVAQYGEVVFDNLPNARLKFTFDHSLWQATISRQANGTQTLVMRSLKPGVQRVCDVKWEFAQ